MLGECGLNGTKREFIDLALGVVRALSDNYSQELYAPREGLPELRSITADRHKVKVEQVCVTAGASLGLAAALAALDQKGEVLCPLPYYPAYPTLICAFGHKPVFYHLSSALEWLPDVSEIESKISSATRAIIINNPVNPCGQIIPATLLSQISAAVSKYQDLVVICDEVASEFCYDDLRVPASGQIFSAAQLVQLRSFSKALAVPGLRLGYALAAEQRVQQLSRAHWSLSLGASFSSQFSLLKIFKDRGWEDVDSNIEKLRANRELFLSMIGEVSCKPAGGIFAWLRSPDANSANFCSYLQSSYQVTAMPGTVFGCPEFFRICLGASAAEFALGLGAVKKAILSYPRR